MNIYIGADHRGFAVKQLLLTHLEGSGHTVIDEGAYEIDPQDDYTVFAEKVANKVSNDIGSKGILICGSGVGVDVTANKIDGVRASIGISPEQVAAGRADDDMNVLVIAADFIQEEAIWTIVDSFLSTEFDEKESHKRRLMDITEIEKHN